MDKILIIEDDQDIAELIKDYFEASNFEVRIETNGRVGLNTALNNQFDIILLDIMLPEISGFEICKELRKNTNVPILFVSARESDVDVIRGLGLGADDYVRKPFKPSELVARVKTNLVRYRTLINIDEEKKETNIIEFKDFVIDLDARRVIKSGNELSLTNKEYEMLAFFVQNKNKVHSREAIFSKVWDFTYGDINTVTVHIKRLREKIEEDPNSPTLIETVRGAGYRFNA